MSDSVPHPSVFLFDSHRLCVTAPHFNDETSFFPGNCCATLKFPFLLLPALLSRQVDACVPVCFAPLVTANSDLDKRSQSYLIGGLALVHPCS